MHILHFMPLLIQPPYFSMFPAIISTSLPHFLGLQKWPNGTLSIYALAFWAVEYFLADFLALQVFSCRFLFC